MKTRESDKKFRYCIFTDGINQYFVYTNKNNCKPI